MTFQGRPDEAMTPKIQNKRGWKRWKLNMLNQQRIFLKMEKYPSQQYQELLNFFKEVRCWKKQRFRTGENSKENDKYLSRNEINRNEIIKGNC